MLILDRAYSQGHHLKAMVAPRLACFFRRSPDKERDILTGNLFKNIPMELPDELIDILGAGPDVRIERIVSRGHATQEVDWYDQAQDEFVLLVQGCAGLQFENSAAVLVLNPGDYLTIGAHVKHRVEWTDATCETIWLAVHYRTGKQGDRR